MWEVHGSGHEQPLRPASAADIDDVRLIQRIAAGELRAFETLYRGYFPRLIRFLDRMVRGAPLMEEVINDTMLVVWNKAHTYNLSSKVSTWIFAIAYRKALKAIKYADEPLDYDFDSCADERSPAPDQEAARAQLQQLVATALDALPLEQRIAVNLSYYHGMGYAEIAEIMDCPENTIKTRMFHARRRLKALLADKLE